MSDLVLYGTIFSPPTRSVLAYLKFSNISFEFKSIDVEKRENCSDWFLKISPCGTFPVIVHNGFNLWESAAIVEYLSEAFSIDSFWYPRELKERSRINAYLHYHHLSVREQVGLYLYPKVLVPIINGTVLTEEQEAPIREKFSLFLQEFKWLISETGFAARNTCSTIADVFAYNEISVAVLFFDIQQHPEIKEWYERFHAIPELKEMTETAHEVIQKAGEEARKRREGRNEVVGSVV